MKVEIYVKEIQALDELMKDAKCPIPMGMVLGTFRVRIQEELNKAQKKHLKEQLDGESKSKNKK